MVHITRPEHILNAQALHSNPVGLYRKFAVFESVFVGRVRVLEEKRSESESEGGFDNVEGGCWDEKESEAECSRAGHCWKRPGGEVLQEEQMDVFREEAHCIAKCINFLINYT